MSERVLVIAPHCDDETLGVGGTLAQLSEAGAQVEVIVISAGKKKGVQDDEFLTRLAEFEMAMAVLGIQKFSILYPGYDTRMHKISHEKMIGDIDRLIEAIRPTKLFFPYSSNHQDHKFVYECSMAAIRMKAGWNVPFVALYEYPFINTNYDTIQGGRYYRNITNKIAEKAAAFGCYKSQLKEKPSPNNVVGMMNLAFMRGAECGYSYAEMFYIIRMLEG